MSPFLFRSRSGPAELTRLFSVRSQLYWGTSTWNAEQIESAIGQSLLPWFLRAQTLTGLVPPFVAVAKTLGLIGPVAEQPCCSYLSPPLLPIFISLTTSPPHLPSSDNLIDSRTSFEVDLLPIFEKVRHPLFRSLFPTSLSLLLF